jgi:ABC-type nitrate/sulfonate/bicarbonate transport system permease component
MNRRERLLCFLASIGLAVLLVMVMAKISEMRLVPPVVLPPPQRIWAALTKGLTRGNLAPMFFATLWHLVVGLTLAAGLGVGLGAMIGTSARARAYLMPTLEFLRPFPSSAIIPVTIAFFGLTETMMLAVIAFGCLWPILLATIHGFVTVEPRLKDVSRALGLSQRSAMMKITLPHAMADILGGMRIGLGMALILATVGEMLTGRNGLGQAILLAARSFRSADLYAGIILLGVIGFASTLIFDRVERRLLRWRS